MGSLLVSCWLIGGFWPFGGVSCDAPFVFAENGQAKAAIVVRTGGRAKGYRYAADELHIEKLIDGCAGGLQ